MDTNSKTCSPGKITGKASPKGHNESCHCGNCNDEFRCMSKGLRIHSNEVAEAELSTKSSKLCREDSEPNKSGRGCCDKVYPSENPTGNPEPPFPSFSGDGVQVHPSISQLKSEDTSSSFNSSLYRSDGDEGEDSTSTFYSASNDYFHDFTDIDSSDIFYSFLTSGSRSSSSASTPHPHSGGDVHYVQSYSPMSSSSSFSQHRGAIQQPAEKIWDAGSTSGLQVHHKSEKLPKLVDFEMNNLIWLPPPPEDVNDDTDNLFTSHDDNDEGGNLGDGNLPTADVDILFPVKDVDCKEPLKSIVMAHFKALVSQLVHAQHVALGDWLEVITAIALQAAKYIKPDTSKGGSMDPCDYLKIKCVASGHRSESKVVKGIACTKNIKHKRMMSHYNNARLLILGGSLEYEKTHDGLASVQALLQQENDYLNTVVSKIAAHHPNVLLVERTVSSYALNILYEKDISVVLNVKRPLLERIARCTTANIIPSTEHISSAKLGHCELFYLEKLTEDHETANQLNKKPSKTLMFFEGCLRRVCCTIVLKGAPRGELKKVKQLLPYAVFAAYHLLLETSFLANEGACLPDMDLISSRLRSETISMCMLPTDSESITCYKGEANLSSMDSQTEDLLLDHGLEDSLSELKNSSHDYFSVPDGGELCECENTDAPLARDDATSRFSSDPVKAPVSRGDCDTDEVEVCNTEKVDDAVALDEHICANDNNQSILVSFSSHCMVNETACEKTRLLRVKFYGPSDKPLGRYLRDYLFDQSNDCKCCHEPIGAHVMCYTHKNANLTIKVRHLPSVKLPGERDGKIWMWHRCLSCEFVDGVPPATNRVVMSDIAWGLSFGKFLELSFCSHVTGNRAASCGHSLQRDCLRFFGFGSMVASFQYSKIDILSVHLPPSILEFSHPIEQNWIRREAYELFEKSEAFYAEISSMLEALKMNSLNSMDGFSDESELHRRVTELNDKLVKEKNQYKDLHRLANKEISQMDQAKSDFLELERLSGSLAMSYQSWDDNLYSLEELLARNTIPEAQNDYHIGPSDADKLSNGIAYDVDCQDFIPESYERKKTSEVMSYSPAENLREVERMPGNGGNAINNRSLVRLRSDASILSDRIDSAWSGFCEDIVTDLGPVAEFEPAEPIERSSSSPLDHLGTMCKSEGVVKNMPLARLQSDASILSDRIDSAWSGVDQSLIEDDPSMSQTTSFRQRSRLMETSRESSFDSAQRAQERMRKRLHPSSLYLSTQRGFHSSADLQTMTRDPCDSGKMDLASPVVPLEDVAFDNEPTNIVSYALGSKEYEDWIFNRKVSGNEGVSHSGLLARLNSLVPDLSPWHSFSSANGDHTNNGVFTIDDQNGSPHLHISFASGKVKYSVICYFAKNFDALRRKCCPSETDFIRSLSRCRKWGAQGGKSNVYFAKSLDERFVIKQVTKTELESFEEFGPNYFKYLTEAVGLHSPTCLAKVLGIYQVSARQVKGGKEVKKMDLMVMENLFFKRSISKVYDLKGSVRSRYISDTRGSCKVLLDMNLLETVCKNPIFVGSKAKRNLERAVWNDTHFLASVDVMDYSLLVGVDEERKELVMGIIDFMRQYTWDKHLETWVKASGILGGPKNVSPTIISPKQYKKRFRKAMTSYFLTVPDQWTS